MSNFKSKEEYHNFISAWKSATNSEEAKSKKVICNYSEHMWYGRLNDKQIKNYKAKGFTVSDDGKTIKKKDGSHFKDPGWMDASHYIFRNMMLGKDPKRGFTPITNKRKLPEYENPWRGFINAAWDLRSILQDAQQHVDQLSKGQKPSHGNHARQFLKPFGGKLQIADLIKIDKEALEQARKFHR